jgi:chromate reductase
MSRIALITGNTRDDSPHAAALRTAIRLAPAEIAAVPYGGLRTLPAFVPGLPEIPEPVAALRHAVRAADALLFCTPEYAGSLPGSLKNLLDWLVDGGDLVDRPAAWLFVSAGGQEQGAVAALRQVLEHGRARIVRAACLHVPVGPDAVDELGTVDDPRLRMALADLLQALARETAAPTQRQVPSWQAVSSVYPMVRPPQRQQLPPRDPWA